MTPREIEAFYLKQAIDSCEAFRESLAVVDWLEMVRETFLRLTSEMTKPIEVEGVEARLDKLTITFNRPLTLFDIPQIKIILPPRAEGSAEFDVGVILGTGEPTPSEVQ